MDDIIIRNVVGREVQDYIFEISILHTDAMAEEPWCENWSNDLDGTDHRVNSPAMFRKLLKEGADFFFVQDCKSRVVGLGVGMRLSREYLASMEWGRAINEYSPRCPEPGDYEMNLVVIHKDYRKNGLMNRLVNARIAVAKNLLSSGRRIWVQTISPKDSGSYGTNAVLSRYERLGFSESGRLRIKNTLRVFLSCEIKKLIVS